MGVTVLAGLFLACLAAFHVWILSEGFSTLEYNKFLSAVSLPPPLSPSLAVSPPSPPSPLLSPRLAPLLSHTPICVVPDVDHCTLLGLNNSGGLKGDVADLKSTQQQNVGGGGGADMFARRGSRCRSQEGRRSRPLRAKRSC
eukprot:339620-Rhodomonas_salina.1